MIITDSGAELSGESLNFEIEYLDKAGCYREAVFAVLPDYTLTIAIVVTSDCEAILWVAKDGGFHPLYIRFPHGLHELVDFKRPAVLGGQSILDQIIR